MQLRRHSPVVRTLGYSLVISDLTPIQASRYPPADPCISLLRLALATSQIIVEHPATRRSRIEYLDILQIRTGLLYPKLFCFIGSLNASALSASHFKEAKTEGLMKSRYLRFFEPGPAVQPYNKLQQRQCVQFQRAFCPRSMSSAGGLGWWEVFFAIAPAIHTRRPDRQLERTRQKGKHEEAQ